MDKLWGNLIRAGLASIALWQGLGPERRQQILSNLNSLAAELARQRAEQERQEHIGLYYKSLNVAPPSTQEIVRREEVPQLSPFLVALQSVSAPSGLQPAAIVEPDVRWRKIIVHPSVVLILGKRGSGKSALGYRLLELFRYVAAPFVVGVPRSARSILPEWIGIASSLEEVPPKAIALVDKAYLHYHARGSMAQESKAMSQVLNLSRQREQTLIFVSQEARQVDKNIASSASAVIFKDLGMLQLEFDRPEFSRLATQAGEAFATVKGDRRRWAFVYAPDADFLGLLENALPSFWKPSLSHLYAGESAPAQPRTPKRMTPQEKARKAKELRASKASLKEIAEALGVTRGTVVNYLKGYPYRR